MSKAQTVGAFRTYRIKTSKHVLAVSTKIHQAKAWPMALLKMSVIRIQDCMGNSQKQG